MWLAKLAKAADSIYKIMRPLSNVLVFIAGAALVAMMFLTVIDVCLRYFFNKPFNGAFDLTEYSMVTVFALGLLYSAVQKKHIKVDILMERIPRNARGLIDTFIAPFSLGIFSLIAWQSIEYTLIQYNTNFLSAVLEIPRYPFVALLFLGYTGFAIVLLADFLNLTGKEIRR
jgi:TRAP-type C4-dicarboxylate transport system permease small subunit